MEGLRFARFRVAFKTMERASLPRDKGPMFRHGLIPSLREAGCSIEAAPFPFVFNPPTDDRERIFAGDTILTSLVLVGTASDQVERYIAGLSRHARAHLRMTLEQIEMLDPRDGKYVSFYFGKEQTIKTRVVAFEWQHIQARAGLLLGRDRIALNFLSPLRMQREVTGDARFLQALQQRVLALSGGCAQPLTHDVRVEPALEWHERPRRLSNGYGSIVLRGNLDGLFPLLVAGQHLHLGAGATSGFGRYELGP